MARPTIKELQGQLTAQESDLAALLKANEQIVGEYTLLARRVEELSYIDLNNITGANDEILPQAKRVETIMRIRRLRAENPMAKQAIKLTLRFVLGKGVTYEIREANTKRIIDDFWNDPINQVVWNSHFAMITAFDELLTDGEQFVVFFDSPGEPPYVRMGILPMSEVTNILYDPDNNRVPIWYRRVYKPRKWDAKLNNNQGGWAMADSSEPVVKYYRDFRVTDDYLTDVEERGLSIPESLRAEGKVKHRLLNPVAMRSGLRGVSELFASREWFRVFKEFMEDRGAINAMANALAMQRKITGGPVAVAGMTGRLGGMQVTPSSDSPLLPSSFRRPLAGSMVDVNKNVDLSSIRADTGAPGASRDAELIRSTAGAGTGTPDHYFGATNAALAGAQSVEIAVVKMFEEMQTYLRNDARETAEYVLSRARDVPVSEVSADAREMVWNFPPIMTHDIVKWVTAFAQWAQQVAPKNREIRKKAIRSVATVLGINEIEMIWPEVEAEEKRLADLEDEANAALKQQREAQVAAAAAGPVGTVPFGAKNEKNGNGNGDKSPAEGGQKTGGQANASGSSPDMTRMVAGRPPREGATGPRSRRQ